MASSTCPQCGKEFDDEELLCPHCGAAQIPQLSKAELRVRNLQASRGPYAASLLGTAAGVLVGGVVLAVALARGQATLGHWAGLLLGGMLGGAVGLVVHYYVLAGRK